MLTSQDIQTITRLCELSKLPQPQFKEDGTARITSAKPFTDNMLNVFVSHGFRLKEVGEWPTFEHRPDEMKYEHYVTISRRP